jgi:hypothetical protein
VVGDSSLDTFKRYIVIETRSKELKRISELHPAHMALQYPPLFTYGERGFQVGVLYSGMNQRNSDEKKNKYIDAGLLLLSLSPQARSA